MNFNMNFKFGALFAAVCAPPNVVAALAPPPHSYILPSGQINGTSAVDWSVGQGGGAFDGPHISVNNGTAYQWWYFDAVSSTGDAAVTVQFYPGLTSAAHILLFNAVWPNGTTVTNLIPVGDLEMTTIGDGSQGEVEDGVLTWFGTEDLSLYRITVDVPAPYNIVGSILLQSRAAPHVSCGPKVESASYHLTPTLGWANSVPDALATVDLTIDGTSLAITGGNGYHDMNWGPISYNFNLTEWYWGHASVGPYSLVWFYLIDSAQNVTTSAYLSRGKKIVQSSCEHNSLVVRPLGPNITFPTKENATITGWTITVAGNEPGDITYQFDIRNIHHAQKSGTYDRWTGFVTGGPTGKRNLTGAAIAERMYHS